MRIIRLENGKGMSCNVVGMGANRKSCRIIWKFRVSSSWNNRSNEKQKGSSFRPVLGNKFFLFPTCYVGLTSIYRKCCRRFLRDSDNSAKIEIIRALPFQHGKIMFKCFGCRSWNINHVKYVGCLIVKQEFVHSTWMVYTWKMTEPSFMQYVLQHFLNTAHAIISI